MNVMRMVSILMKLYKKFSATPFCITSLNLLNLVLYELALLRNIQFNCVNWQTTPGLAPLVFESVALFVWCGCRSLTSCPTILVCTSWCSLVIWQFVYTAQSSP